MLDGYSAATRHFKRTCLLAKEDDEDIGMVPSVICSGLKNPDDVIVPDQTDQMEIDEEVPQERNPVFNLHKTVSEFVANVCRFQVDCSIPRDELSSFLGWLLHAIMQV